MEVLFHLIKQLAPFIPLQEVFKEELAVLFLLRRSHLRTRTYRNSKQNLRKPGQLGLKIVVYEENNFRTLF
jgi:hypothetical protein